MIKEKKEFKNLIPRLTKEEFVQLENNVLEEGIRDPLITWNGFIIDGHHRFELAKKHKLLFKIAEKQFKNENEVKLWMINNQKGRRNLTDFVKYELAQIKADILREIAKSNKMGRGKVLSTIDKTNVRDEVAKDLKWSTGKVAMADMVAKESDETIKEKLRKNEISINQVYKDIKKEKKNATRLEEARKAEKIKITNDLIDLRLGDFKNVLEDIPDGSVDLILTDPPYSYDFIKSWSELSEFAQRKLKPNGFCLAYSGQLYLPEVITRLSEHLDYYWTIGLFHKNGGNQLVNAVNVICEWKPILVFQNGKKQRKEVFIDTVYNNKGEKDLHEWQQGLQGISLLMSKFVKAGDVVVDPFSGGGTTIIAGLQNKCKVIAAEIEKEPYNLTKKRIKIWLQDKK